MKFKTFKEMYDYLIKHKDEIYPKNSEAFMDDSFDNEDVRTLVTSVMS